MTERATVPSPRTEPTRRWLAAMYFAAAVVAAAAALCLFFWRSDWESLVLSDTGDPAGTVTAFFDSAARGDWTQASRCVRGTPSLSLSAPGTGDEAILWDAFVHSWEWSLGDGAKPDDLHAWQRVRFSCLRPDVLTTDLSGDIQAVLARRVEEAESRWEVYTEDGEYRPEVVHAALTEVLSDRIRQGDAYRVSAEVTVELLYEDGRWQILPEENLWNLLSGVPEGRRSP